MEVIRAQCQILCTELAYVGVNQRFQVQDHWLVAISLETYPWDLEDELNRTMRIPNKEFRTHSLASDLAVPSAPSLRWMSERL